MNCSHTRQYAGEIGAGDAPLTNKDLVELSAGAQRIFETYGPFEGELAGAWFSKRDAEMIAMGDEGLRRAREIRNRPGYDLEKRRDSMVTRRWVYRIVRT